MMEIGWRDKLMERVAIYNRCSTEEENQKNALFIQTEESRELAELMGWQVVEQYVEAQSGTSTNKRKAYRRMMEDMEEKKFDIVMIKSIDRLTRNTKDWYMFLDCLTRNEMRLYLYLERKFYMSEDALVNGIKAILAEEFSKELSKKIKNAHKRRQEKGLGLNITRQMYGFRKVAKDCYEIHEKQAEYIKMALRLAENGYGYRRISNALYDQGARTFDGKRISETQWRNILRSPRLHGTVVLNTTSYDFDKKKRIHLPKEQWIYKEQALPEIVSREEHERVLVILDERRQNCEKTGRNYRGKNKNQYSLSNKLFCGCCGSVFYRTKRVVKGEEVVYWTCSNYIKMGAKKEDGRGCSNRKLEEKQLRIHILQSYMEQHREAWDRSNYRLERFRQLLDVVLQDTNYETVLLKLQSEYDKILKEENVLMEKLLQGIVEDEQFCNFMEKKKKEKIELHKRMEAAKEECQLRRDYRQRSERIWEALETGELFWKTFEELSVDAVKKIIVYENAPCLEIKWSFEEG